MCLIACYRQILSNMVLVMYKLKVILTIFVPMGTLKLGHIKSKGYITYHILYTYIKTKELDTEHEIVTHESIYL